MSKLVKVLCVTILGLIPFAILAPAAAQTQAVQYQCNLGGMPAMLTAQLEVIGNSGITYNSMGGISGVIGTGESTVYYQGELRSQTANYVFTGENQYADFTDMMSYERFRVQFLMQPNGSLVLVANPFGPQPARYLCTPSQG